MKLIDILVEETIENGWSWPEHANCITQDCDREIMPATCQPSVAKFEASFNRWFLKGSRIDRFTADVLASDYENAIITREQYEAALAAKNEGWIDFAGGECPALEGVLVEVKYRNEKNYHIKGVNRAGRWSWAHYGTDGDIIAYRLHQSQEAEQAEADDEADLNECIGQATASLWNGEGLPPVGCECECQFRGEWQKCTILFSGKQIVVAMVDDDEYPFESKGSLFRPIRSEEDEKRDDRASAIDGFISGFRGQETGSNKELAYALTDYLALLDKL